MFGAPFYVSRNNEKLKIVVTGAHPDDPETGCGGLIAKMTNEGHEVTIGYLTKGEAGIYGVSHEDAARIRTIEAKKACEILKAKYFFLGQIDGSTVVNEEAYLQMSEFLKAEKPDLLFTHWPIDAHRDHRICSILTYDAWLGMENRPNFYYYEVLTGEQTQTFNPTDFVDITSVIDIKHKACFVHSSQNIKQYYPGDHGKMEEFRGMQGGYEHAEAFVAHTKNNSRF
ncbi:PIG-L family deacetylase [uncultured Croceitalea sp.]|uniref:PIG-L deacetylase family protein n=1 Tax=uncultured Croceitalea sp. TaxID=1798908 RepID=UPI003305E26D